MPDDEYFVTIDETLAGREAGGSARRNARELRGADPLGTIRDRILRQHSDERAWRKGATGEKSDGVPFFGCSKFPRCRRTKPIT
jgi:hypothetical protein